eukprot:m.227599 g.227599  ORF g.227599 m.227599 type:complete len:549 (+) comp10851_c3_seq9:2575-4221(+)
MKLGAWFVVALCIGDALVREGLLKKLGAQRIDLCIRSMASFALLGNGSLQLVLASLAKPRKRLLQAGLALVAAADDLARHPKIGLCSFRDHRNMTSHDDWLVASSCTMPVCCLLSSSHSGLAASCRVLGRWFWFSSPLGTNQTLPRGWRASSATIVNAPAGCRHSMLVLALAFLAVLGAVQPGVRAGNVKARSEHYLPTYGPYHNTTGIEAHLRDFVARNGHIAQLERIGTSRNGTPLWALHITRDIAASTVSKQAVLLSFGEHARELIPVESMFALIEHLAEQAAAPSSLWRLLVGTTWAYDTLDNIDLYISPMINPDGRRHLEAHQNYCWRGTGSGVDLNRNFDWEFGGPGSSVDPHDEEYRGSAAHSEPETQALVRLASARPYAAFVSFHSGIRQIYTPFCDAVSRSTGRQAKYEKKQLQLAMAMASAVPGFEAGLGRVLNSYPADGTAFDFMAGKLQIPLSLAVELWGPRDSSEVECFDLFNPEPAHLQAAVDSLIPLYAELFKYLLANEIATKPHRGLYVFLFCALAGAAIWHRRRRLRAVCV